MPGLIGDGLLLGWADDSPVWSEPFNLGSVNLTTVEPFDIVGPKAVIVTEEPFWILGGATLTTVEPYDLGFRLSFLTTEPFDILDSLTGVGSLPPYVPGDPAGDLGDGDVTPADAELDYGYWVPDTDTYEDLGTVTTD